MNKFKRIIMSLNGQNKSDLHILYTDRMSKGACGGEKIYEYRDLKFRFEISSHRTPEKLTLYIMIPESLLGFEEYYEDSLPMEDYLLRCLSPYINALCRDHININKDAREKAFYEAQSTNEIVIKRNGMLYLPENKEFLFRINFAVPLINGTSINAKHTLAALKEILDTISEKINNLDVKQCKLYLDTYKKQVYIRNYMKENGIIVFVANRSILPRDNGTSAKKENAIEFYTPESLKKTITFEDGTCISGMALIKGVTVITGGGYAGKSTLLDAIEVGIYNHIPKDGREFVLTDETAIKIYAEDGRPVHSTDLTPFYNYLPAGIDIHEFSTLHASGSVSQAANIIEAVSAGSKLLLIDEDKSATNFMSRDLQMRKIIKKEPIIPFTDRIRELYEEESISTILVIGGSSEYLYYADTIVVMDDYSPIDITNEVKSEFMISEKVLEIQKANWVKKRFLMPKETTQAFLFFRTINTENSRKIILDEYCSDITFLTALITDYQLNALAYAMDQLLTNKEAGDTELICIAQSIAESFHVSTMNKSVMMNAFRGDRWLEAIRPIDIVCCINRMRGVKII